MDDDGKQSELLILRGAIREAAEACQDPDLLDLIYKLLIEG